MIYFLFFQKAENNRLRNCNIIFLFLLKIGSVGPVDQQINLVSPYSLKLKMEISNSLTVTVSFTTIYCKGLKLSQKQTSPQPGA